MLFTLFLYFFCNVTIFTPAFSGALDLKGPNFKYNITFWYYAMLYVSHFLLKQLIMSIQVQTLICLISFTYEMHDFDLFMASIMLVMLMYWISAMYYMYINLAI